MKLSNQAPKITPKQLLFLINGSIVGAVWVYLPRSVVDAGYQNAWMAVLISVLYPVIGLLTMNKALGFFPGMSFIALSWRLFGKLLGSVLLAVVILYFTAAAGVIATNYARLTQAYILPNTPIAVIIMVIVICAFLVAVKGISVTAWFNEITLYLILLLMLVYLLPLRSGDYTNLLPIGQIPLKDLARATLQAIWAQSGIEVLLVFYSLVDQPKKVVKYGFIGIGLGTLIYCWVTLACIVVLGTEVTKTMLWPGLYILKVSEAEVFQRLEFFSLLFMLFIVSRSIVTDQVAGAHALSEMFKSSHQIYPYVVSLVSLGSLIIAFLPHNIIDVSDYSTYVSYLALVIGIGYPLLYWLAAKLRGGKE